ncbi:MAG: hypothetical protein M3417_09855 [Actinomycetota bacterium]|nr:hypothetical protein [Actinomycetota bacterium]
MTRKAEFNAEEWSTVTAAPALAAIAVAAADRGGTLREGMSMARTYQEARRTEHTELVEELLASPPGVSPTPATDAEQLRERAMTAVRGASDLLREKATAPELRDFGDFVVRVCEAVARAHKEGGVLGLGGKEVSEPEQAVLDAIAAALGPRPARDA